MERYEETDGSWELVSNEGVGQTGVDSPVPGTWNFPYSDLRRERKEKVKYLSVSLKWVRLRKKRVEIGMSPY